MANRSPPPAVPGLVEPGGRPIAAARSPFRERGLVVASSPLLRLPAGGGRDRERAGGRGNSSGAELRCYSGGGKSAWERAREVAAGGSPYAEKMPISAECGEPSALPRSGLGKKRRQGSQQTHCCKPSIAATGWRTAD